MLPGLSSDLVDTLLTKVAPRWTRNRCAADTSKTLPFRRPNAQLARLDVRRPVCGCRYSQPDIQPDELDVAGIAQVPVGQVHRRTDK